MAVIFALFNGLWIIVILAVMLLSVWAGIISCYYVGVVLWGDWKKAYDANMANNNTATARALGVLGFLKSMVDSIRNWNIGVPLVGVAAAAIVLFVAVVINKVSVLLVFAVAFLQALCIWRIVSIWKAFTASTKLVKVAPLTEEEDAELDSRLKTRVKEAMSKYPAAAKEVKDLLGSICRR